MNKANEKNAVPNQHLADAIAGKVDHLGNPLSAETESIEETEAEPESESTPETESTEATAPTNVPNQHLADKLAGKIDESGNPIESVDNTNGLPFQPNPEAIAELEAVENEESDNVSEEELPSENLGGSELESETNAGNGSTEPASEPESGELEETDNSSETALDEESPAESE